MSNVKCQKCGAECVDGTSFCRQCGAPIDDGSTQIASEQTTALLNQNDGVTTQPLESRATGPNRGRMAVPAGGPGAGPSERRAGGRRAIFIGALIIVVIGIICAAALIGMRSHNAASSDLIYPGAKTVVDMTMDGGGRALHLQTSDAFSTVEAWYQKELKPDKTMRLTSTSVVLKNKTTTATIAAEDNKTNILIKVSN